MRVASREAFRIVPRWYGELNLGLSLILFAAITVYPWRGTTSAVALAVAVSVAIAGALVLLHSVTLAKRACWVGSRPTTRVPTGLYSRRSE